MSRHQTNLLNAFGDSTVTDEPEVFYFMKKTKRKGFNFFRSYYDVYNMLESDKDKVDFIEALLDKQFLGVNPKDLKGMVKFAWVSQVNSIDSQVKGYEDKTKTMLDGTPYIRDKTTPTEGGRQGGLDTPTEQVEEKGEVKVEGECVYFTQETFVNWFNECRRYLNLKSNIKRLSQYEKADFEELVKDYNKEDFKNAFKSFSVDEYYLNNNLIFPKYFLKQETFTKYLNTDVKQTAKQNTGGDVNLW